MSSSRQQSSNIKLSKAMSWLLRHRAEQEGIPIRPDGFVRVKDMLSHKRFKQYKLADVQREVAINDKLRYALVEEEGNDGEKEWLVRANQGHSIKIEAVEMTKINFPAEIPTVIHGTYSAYWPSIEKQGLSKMRRNHIHFAAGMLGDEGVISGMRKTCDLFVHVDVEMAIADGIIFYRSANNVILTDGRDGFLEPKYFKKVVDRRGEVVFPKSG